MKACEIPSANLAHDFCSFPRMRESGPICLIPGFAGMSGATNHAFLESRIHANRTAGNLSAGAFHAALSPCLSHQ